MFEIWDLGEKPNGICYYHSIYYYYYLLIGWYETLMTPFGPYAEGEATRPGQQFQSQAAAV